MDVLVVNCFHWIGFHYVNFLLEQGIVVKGMDEMDSTKKENLSMFVGRNSSFEFINPRNSVNTNTVIIIGNKELPSNISSEKVIRICHENIENNEGNTVVIQTPILIGEWMDMTKKGVIMQNHLIPFESEEFQSNAVHIQDFMKETMPSLQKEPTSLKLHVWTKKIFLDETVRLENLLYISDNRPIEKSVEKLVAHYQRYKDLY